MCSAEERRHAAGLWSGPAHGAAAVRVRHPQPGRGPHGVLHAGARSPFFYRRASPALPVCRSFSAPPGAPGLRLTSKRSLRSHAGAGLFPTPPRGPQGGPLARPRQPDQAHKPAARSVGAAGRAAPSRRGRAATTAVSVPVEVRGEQRAKGRGHETRGGVVVVERLPEHTGLRAAAVPGDGRTAQSGPPRTRPWAGRTNHRPYLCAQRPPSAAVPPALRPKEVPHWTHRGKIEAGMERRRGGKPTAGRVA